MSELYKYLIEWADGHDSEHVSNEHPTMDHVANSVFGRPTAAQVEDEMGHTITPLGRENVPLPAQPLKSAQLQKSAQPLKSARPSLKSAQLLEGENGQGEE